mmetsp:Transcript_33321/g.43964  ORF Transcript_33321/g.43964 Transcript_33321/m.43964 type:complete len:396 (-) Transcript_33321:198-1385(-)|eukprot:CAMPEP_0117837852 /NCGR_PEP_ID=MMETSP0949-20121206/12963_1 /TAXON_ID=44440 /ORGANISM="Chattonella subsalsa, Strain CCMP2191" /LENGTH=395 /DNA_ID=CAMNT_0005680383 /DNA_START=25 /DNA_END=1212 /DNA_ORIENTATION=-
MKTLSLLILFLIRIFWFEAFLTQNFREAGKYRWKVKFPLASLQSKAGEEEDEGKDSLVAAENLLSSLGYHTSAGTSSMTVPPQPTSPLLSSDFSASYNKLLPPLSDSELLHFERQGFLITKGLCTEKEIEHIKGHLKEEYSSRELDAYRQKVMVCLGEEAWELCETKEDCQRLLNENLASDMIPFLQVFNLWRTGNLEIQKFILAKRFAHTAAQLLGVKRVRLYQDSMFVKRPQDGPTLWHSDLNMAPLDTNSFVTVWIPLQEVPPQSEGGTSLTFAGGSHKDFALAYWQDPHAGEDLEGRYDVTCPGHLNIGDATWHHGWLLHSAPENGTPFKRQAITISYIADGAKVLSEDCGFMPDDEDSWSYQDWLYELDDRTVNHPLVPLVYDSDIDEKL